MNKDSEEYKAAADDDKCTCPKYQPNTRDGWEFEKTFNCPIHGLKK